MENVDAVFTHVEKTFERVVDPISEDVKNLKIDIWGNGKDGLKTISAVHDNLIHGNARDIVNVGVALEKSSIKLEDKIDKVEAKVDKILWLAVTSAISGITSLVFGIIFFLLSK